MNNIIQLYIDELATANHNKIIYQAKVKELKEKIVELENKVKQMENKENGNS